MNAIARRLDPCANWFRLVSRTHGRILWLFPALLFVGWLAAVRENLLTPDWMKEHYIYDVNAPLSRQARELNLDYEAVLVKPGDFIGKPVVWCVDTPAAKSSYVSGRPSWPVALNGEYDVYRTNPGHCLNVLAVITGFENGLIQLRPVERL
ncbi:MAG: hypothetical protein ACHQ51_07730 [Elusimicrobiota bacterium]